MLCSHGLQFNPFHAKQRLPAGAKRYQHHWLLRAEAPGWVLLWSLRSFTLQITPVQAKQELKIIYANQPAELLGGSPAKNQPASSAFQARNAIPSLAVPGGCMRQRVPAEAGVWRAKPPPPSRPCKSRSACRGGGLGPRLSKQIKGQDNLLQLLVV